MAPAHSLDAGRVAQWRVPPIGSDEQARAQLPTPGKRNRNASAIGGEGLHLGLKLMRYTGCLRDGGKERRSQPCAFDDPCSGLIAADTVVIADQHGANGVLQRRVGNVDGAHGLRVRRQICPHTERFQHPLGAGGEGIGARVHVGRARRLTLDQGDAHLVSERQGQRARQGKSGKAATDDDNVGFSDHTLSSIAAVRQAAILTAARWASRVPTHLPNPGACAPPCPPGSPKSPRP